MPVIPSQGANNNTWGTDLNAYLAVALNAATGALNSGVVHYSTLGTDAGGYWTGLIVAAAAPTGTAATDTANTATVWNAGANGMGYQLGAGTYVLNPTTLTKAVHVFGAPNKGTTIQLAGQGAGANAAVFSIGTSGIRFDGIVFDGNGTTVGSGNYWSGVVSIGGGINDIDVIRCTFRNTARSAIYANGTNVAVNRLRVEDCLFTNIGTPGAQTGGSCIMFDGGVNDSTIVSNRAVFPLTSNFIKLKQGDPYGIGGGAPTGAAHTVVSSTTTVVTVAAAALTTGAGSLVGMWLLMQSGTQNAQTRIITANTANTITIAPALNAAPAANDLFYIMSNCIGNNVSFNRIDYSGNSATAWDTVQLALGIEMFNGAWGTRCIGNVIIGPTLTPTSSQLWGISCGDARYSTVANNIIQGDPTNVANSIIYGIETAECPDLTIHGNTIRFVNTGSNCTNSNPTPSHAQSIVGNIYDTCYTSGIVSDNGTSGIKIIANTFVDCGTRYVFLNSAGSVSRQVTIANNTFQIRDQTRLDGSGEIYAIYAVGSARTDVVPADISGNYFGPYPGGTGTVGLVPLEINNPQGVRFLNNRCEGTAPTGGATANHAVNGDCYNVTVKGNYGRNYGSGYFGYADSGQISVWEDNDIGTLLVGNIPTAAAGANAGTSPPAPVVPNSASPKGGSLTFGTGATVNPTAGAQVVVTFPYKMLAAPFVVLASQNTATQALGLYVSAVTNAGFTINCTTAPAASQANTIYSVAWHSVVS